MVQKKKLQKLSKRNKLPAGVQFHSNTLIFKLKSPVFKPEIIIPYTTQKDFNDIEEGAIVRIISELEKFLNNPSSVDFRKLKGYDYHRITVDDYRLIINIDEDLRQVIIVRIGHRKDVYKNLDGLTI